VLDIYIRVGMDSMDAYEADFETDLLSTTATFYKRKARAGNISAAARAASSSLMWRSRLTHAGTAWLRIMLAPHEHKQHLTLSTCITSHLQAAVWIAEDSCPEYMVKAEECLRQEEDRVLHYLHISTKPKLLEQVHLMHSSC
jgi:hypothetical protein